VTSGRSASLPIAVALVLGLFAASSCRTDASSSVQVPAGHAICPVCRAQGDLACQDVAIRPETPSSEHLGVTYYFCSQQCREDFDRDPETYLGR
jgi:hypothetical protein